MVNRNIKICLYILGEYFKDVEVQKKITERIWLRSDTALRLNFRYVRNLDAVSWNRSETIRGMFANESYGRIL